MKKCTVCNQTKEDSAFAENREKCRTCRSTESRDRLRTKEGVVRRIYSSQKTNSKNRGHNPPTYSLDELLEYMLSSRDYLKLYDAWVADGYSKLMKPSIDRIDNSMPYTFSNIQIMTWLDNKNKGHCDSKTDRLSTGKTKRAVLQFTNDFTYIKEFISVREAERQTLVKAGDISSVCKYYSGESTATKKSLTAGGFIWKYKILGLDVTEI